MTSSGKVRIYELSRDLGLENKDVLDAAEKLGVAAKSHSSSISDDEASRIRSLIETGSNGSPAAAPANPAAPPKAILSVKKAGAGEAPQASAPAPAATKPTSAPAAMKPAAPAKPVMPPARPVAATPSKPPLASKPAVVAKPTLASAGRGVAPNPVW
jgi:translation initiation factor IF-2